MNNSVLLYITNFDVSKYLILENFVNVFYKNKINLITLFENYKEYDFFLKKNSIKKIFLYEEDNLEKNHQNIYLKNINPNLKSFYKDEVVLNKKYIKSFLTIDNFIKKNEINHCIINIGQEVLNSFTGCVLDQYCKEKKINFYFPMANSPLNGRYMIYEDIYLTNNNFNNYYISTYNSLNRIDFEKLNNFKNLYINNEYNFIKRYKKFDSNSLKIYNIQDIFSKFKDFFYKYFIYNKKKFEIHTSKPYVLFLINKSDDHWYTKYSNIQNLNRKELIKKVLDQIPNNYNLIVKCHPRKSFEKSLEKSFYKNKRVKIVYEDSKNPNTTLVSLLKDAKFIIGSGTTSLIVSLLFNKIVFDISKVSAYFNFQDPPVILVKHIKDLGNMINNIENFDHLNKKIDSYFFSLMNISLPFYKQNSISHIVDENTSALVGESIYKLIVNGKK